MFGTLRDRAAANIQIKFFNFLLVPLQTSLVAGVQERINVLTDDELEVRAFLSLFLPFFERMFIVQAKFEASASKTRLLDEERLLAVSVDALREMEGALLENASRFITAI